MFIPLQRVILSLVLALWAALATAQGIVAERNPLLYAISSKTTTVYLFGTIHLGSHVLYPLPDPIEGAFKSAKVLALEIDPTEQSELRAALALSFYAPPDTLQAHVAAPVFARARAAATGYNLPLEAVQQMKPYTLSIALAFAEMEKLGFDARLGLDLHLAMRAHQDGKRVIQLESMRQQAEILDRLSPAMQLALLTTTMDGIRSGELANETNELFDAWQTGNADWLLELTERENERLPAPLVREFKDKFYINRNRQMAKRIEELLKGRETCFVAVGTAHLVGPGGLVELLGKKSYRLQRM